MAKTDVTSGSQEESPTVNETGRALPTVNERGGSVLGWFSRVWNGTLGGVRRQTELMEAHKECFRTTEEAWEAYIDMRSAPERIDKKNAWRDEKEARAHEKEMLELDIEIERLNDLKKRLPSEHRFEKARLDEELRAVKDRQKPRSVKQEPKIDPMVRRVQERLQREQDALEHIAPLRKKMFAEIDAKLQSGEITEERAAEEKEHIEDVIREEFLKP